MRPSRLRRIVDRLRRVQPSSNKGRLALIVTALFAVVLLVQYLRLPSGDEFRTKAPTTTPLMAFRMEAAKENRTPYLLRYRFVPLPRIAPSLLRAVIVAEDARFFSHGAFDFKELWNAVTDTLLALRAPRGASTITQQLAKNLYLSNRRSPLRKMKEAVLARRLEGKLGKRRILELYLNIIEWGEGIFGAEAAARAYFRKSAATLSEQESAHLAAMIPNPRTVYNPALHPRRVATRKVMILRRMNSVVIPRGLLGDSRS